MAKVDDVVERVREAAAADFAFVLSRRGKLLTRDAPKDMPEVGRGKVVMAARSLAGTNNVGMLSLPRQELVPFGGAAPVDVYIAVADDGAILCVVMATWAERKTVLAAIQSDLANVGERSSASGRRNASANGKRAPKANARDEVKQELKEELKEPTAASKRRQTGPMMGLLAMARAMSAAPNMPSVPVIRDTLPDPMEKGPAPGQASMPEIVIHEAQLGRETLAAVEHEIPIGFSRGESVPDITIETAALGRESMVALEEDARRIYAGSVPDVRVELASISRMSAAEIAAIEGARETVPYVEPAESAKRADSAARCARAEAPPKLSIKLEEAGEEVIDALDRETPPPNKEGRQSGAS